MEEEEVGHYFKEIFEDVYKRQVHIHPHQTEQQIKDGLVMLLRLVLQIIGVATTSPKFTTEGANLTSTVLRPLTPSSKVL